MFFKITFGNGSVEVLAASTAIEAKITAMKNFQGRAIAKVETAGLRDVTRVRARPEAGGLIAAKATLNDLVARSTRNPARDGRK